MLPECVRFDCSLDALRLKRRTNHFSHVKILNVIDYSQGIAYLLNAMKRDFSCIDYNELKFRKILFEYNGYSP